jgi:hypothetical protein
MNKPAAAMDLCTQWLLREEAHQLTERGLPHLNIAETVIMNTMQTDYPYWWRKYRINADYPNPDLASWSIMKFAASARRVAILGHMTLGGAYDTACSATIQNMKEVLPAIVEKNEPMKQWLRGPHTKVMEGVLCQRETIQLGYIMAVGLAVTHRMMDVEQRGEVPLLAPGDERNRNNPWNC